MDKATIARNFSRYAYFYDRYADVQKKAALEILSRIGAHNFKRVLEIGCGTGSYTSLLREKFEKAEITALDISSRMIEVARQKLKDRGIEFIIADAEAKDFRAGAFDLVTSNACFQWFENLEKALKKYKGVLIKNGLLAFSIFGPLTFCELSASLGVLFRDTSITADNFINKDKIKDILEENFKDVNINEAICEESFAGLLQLLNKIKYSGIRGDGLNCKVSLGRRYLERLEEVYLNKFQRIKTTYQIFLCWGRA